MVVAEDLDDSQLKSVTASCPAGKVAIGGGYDVDVADPTTRLALHVVESRPTSDNPPTGWLVDAFWVEHLASLVLNWKLSAHVVCAKVTP